MSCIHERLVHVHQCMGRMSFEICTQGTRMTWGDSIVTVPFSVLAAFAAMLPSREEFADPAYQSGCSLYQGDTWLDRAGEFGRE